MNVPQAFIDDRDQLRIERTRLLAIGIIAAIVGVFLSYALVNTLPDRSECVSLPPGSVYIERTGYWISHGDIVGYQPDPDSDCVEVP